MRDNELQKLIKSSLHKNEEFWTLNTQPKVHKKLGPTQMTTAMPRGLTARQRMLINVATWITAAIFLFYGINQWILVLRHMK